MIRTLLLSCIILWTLLTVPKLAGAQVSAPTLRGNKERVPPEEADRRQARQERQLELQNQASRLIQQGQLQQAIALLEQVSSGGRDAGPLMQMLDLQIRLMDQQGARRSMDSLAARLPANGTLTDYLDFQMAGALAGAHYRLGQPARAAELWKSMKEQARDEQLALAVFHSYRQLRLSDEALAWAREQRRRLKQDDLWAFEMASVHEEAGRPLEAFDELARWQCRQKGAAAVESRLLTLAEGAREKDPLLRHMWSEVKSRRSCPLLGQAVLGVLVQQVWVKEAIALAWELDEDASGALPMELANDLLRDRRHGDCLAVLDELAARQRPQSALVEFDILRAECLSGLGRAEEALDLLRRAAAMGGPRGQVAALQAARLLHRPLGRPAEAARQLDEVLKRQPGDREATRLLVMLEGAQGRDAQAVAALGRMRAMPTGRAEDQTELDWLGLRLDWWAGRLESCRTAMAAFLKTNTRQDVFNDAIELMDLLAFAAKDSLGVMEAAEADRHAYLGQVPEALAQLHGAAEARTGPLSEWLDWRACILMALEAAPAEARAEYARYRQRHAESVRMDRLEWMELEAMTALGFPREQLRTHALSLLERWPKSMLQDAVRRRLREWEEAKAPTAPASDTAQPAPAEGPAR